MSESSTDVAPPAETKKPARKSSGDSAAKSTKKAPAKSAGDDSTPKQEKNSPVESSGGDSKSTGGADKNQNQSNNDGKSQNQDGGGNQNQNQDGGGGSRRQRYRKGRNERSSTNNSSNYKKRRRGGGGGRHEFVEELEVEEDAECINMLKLQDRKMGDLQAAAIELGIEAVGALSRPSLVFEILRVTAEASGLVYGGGVLEMEKEFGYLRSPFYNYSRCEEDIYVNPGLIRRHALRSGDTVMGWCRAPKERDRYPAMGKVHTINGAGPDCKKTLIPFENLTPYFPTERFVLDYEGAQIEPRVVDLVSPIGKGQRGLIVAPPRTGKTVLMQKLANAITDRNPDVVLIVLLVDERPEEVTDMRRTVKGEVVASTFDEPPHRHTEVTELVIDKAKRLVEHGKNVVILLDSLTRLGRAYNACEKSSGRILTGGVDANALHKPRRVFAAARNIENGGSLTILATALVETNSKMDEVIFEEFKGTGNMELCLDRCLSDRRVFPAINMTKSGTRKEELLLHPDELARIFKLRRAMVDMPPEVGMENLIKSLKKTSSNAEFLLQLKSLE
jgi:transcription termination factor Rho